MKSLALFFSAVVATQSSVAAALISADIAGQPQIFMTDGVADSCGVIITAVEGAPGSPKKELLAFNGSVLFSPLGALVKGRAVFVSDAPKNPDGSGIAIRPQKTEHVWLKAKSHKATTPQPFYTPRAAEDPSYLIYGASIDDAMPVVIAALGGESIQIGMKISGMPSESILYGKVRMTSAEIEQVDNCIAEMISSATAKLDEKSEMGEK